MSEPSSEQSAVDVEVKLSYEYSHFTALPHDTTGVNIETVDDAIGLRIEIEGFEGRNVLL
jgi:hypothetical protein